jgi:uncharacterized membrane protein YhaH (DUF805 family)
MNVLRDVGTELFKMFVGDAWLTIGILTLVTLTALLTGAGAVPPLFGGMLLLLGCIVVLLASVVLAVRRFRDC